MTMQAIVEQLSKLEKCVIRSGSGAYYGGNTIFSTGTICDPWYTTRRDQGKQFDNVDEATAFAMKYLTGSEYGFTVEKLPEYEWRF